MADTPPTDDTAQPKPGQLEDTKKVSEGTATPGATTSGANAPRPPASHE